MKKIISCLTATALLMFVPQVTAFAVENTDSLLEMDCSGATVTPEITVDKLVIDKSVKETEVNITVSGADNCYASTGIHVYYDSRLEIAKTESGKIDIKKGEAIDLLYTHEPEDDPLATKEIMGVTNSDYAEYYGTGFNGIFLSTAGDGNQGKDGIMWTINFVIPDDVKEGDVYPIDIIYKESELASDLFYDTERAETGKLMNNYLFTQGIYNTATNSNFYASFEDISEVPALAYIDLSYDGYIAIGKEVQTPTTENNSNLQLIPESLLMNIDDTQSLILINKPENTSIEWASNNTKVATVKDGVVTAIGEGSATIYAVCGSNTVTCNVTVSGGNMIYGDSNGDGQISLADAVAILQYVANPEKYPLSEQVLINADVYNKGDGVTGMDALAIQMYDSGQIDFLPYNP